MKNGPVLDIKNQKCLNLIRGGAGGGGPGFFKNVWNLKKKSELSGVGGGIKPIWEFSKKISYFNYDDSPNLVQLI